MMNYEEACAFLDSVMTLPKKPGNGNTRRLLDLLGHPERRFRVIHVAGTNGKGSCCAFLDSIFRTRGLKTGLFTSPHLVRINERIRVRGEEIPDGEFAEAVDRVRSAVSVLIREGGQELTWFEYLFAAGLCWFEKAGIDLLVMETGLGGRLDVTNTVEKVEAVVITSISLDHMQYLGNTTARIASEKAGIIRENVPVIYCAGSPVSAYVIGRRALEKGAEPIPLLPDSFEITDRMPGSIGVRLTEPDKAPLFFRVPFGADYQAENACLAALCALRLGAGEEDVRTGIAYTRWAGRMQEIRKDVYLDGAHNPDGIRRAADEIRRAARTRRIWLVAAIVADKNHREMVQELCRGVKYEGVIVTSVGGGRQLKTDVLAKEFLSAGQSRVEKEPDAIRAYRRALREMDGGVLFCVGSLYLAGEILALEERERC